MDATLELSKGVDNINIESENDNKLINIKTIQTNPIKTMIEALKDILVDVNIVFSQDGVKIIEIDASQSILVHLKLDRDKFQHYYCSSEQRIVGLSIINLFKLIKTVTNGDILQLYINKEDENILGITIENNEKHYQTNYKLNLLEIDYDHYECPDKQFDCQIILPSQCLQKICRDMNNLSDIVEVQVVNNELIFKCAGDFVKQETIFKENTGNNEENSIVFKENNNDNIIQGYYSLKHLISFTKCTNLCQSVELYLLNNFPLIILYDIGNMGKLKLCLSPKESSDYS